MDVFIAALVGALVALTVVLVIKIWRDQITVVVTVEVQRKRRGESR